jgi:hypothetical protein
MITEVNLFKFREFANLVISDGLLSVTKGEEHIVEPQTTFLLKLFKENNMALGWTCGV